VALSNGLNANLLRRWVAEAEQAGGSLPSADPPAAAQRDGGSTAAFVPLALPASPASTDIRIELQRAGTAINVTWPASAAAECVAWLRELLR
jgi:transposase-like protein